MTGPYDDILNGGPGPKRPAAAAKSSPATPAPAASPADAGFDPYADILAGRGAPTAPTAPPADDEQGSLSRWWHLAKASAYGIQGQVVADAKLALDAGAALTGTPMTAADAARLDPVVASQKQQMRDEQAAAGPARSTLEAFGDFAASAAPYVASYAVGGELLGPEEAAASYGGRVLATTKAALPVTAALELGDKDLSSANTIGTALGQFDHTRALGQMLERMSDSPFGRVLVGGVLDVAGNAIGEGLAEGVGRIKAARQATADAAYEAANAKTIADAPSFAPGEQKLLPAGRYDLPASSADLAGRTTQFEGAPPDQGYRIQANVPAEQDLEDALRARRAAQMAADSPQAAEPRATEPPDYESPAPPTPAVPQRLLTAGAPEPKLLTAGPIRLPGEIAPEEQMRRAVNMARESSGASADEAAVQAEVDRRLNAHYGENPEAAVQMSEGDQSSLRAAVERQVREGRHPGLPAGTGRLAGGAAIAGYDYQHKDDQDVSTRHKLVLGALAAMGLASIPSVRESVYHLIGRGASQAAAHAAAGLSDPAVQRVVKAFAMEARPAAKQSAAAIGERFYREAFDKLYSIGQYGRKVLGSDRLRAEAQRASGVIEAAHESVRLDFTPVAQAAKGIEPQVAALAGAERALELDRIYPGVSKGISTDDAKQTISVLSKIPAIRAATDKVQGYYRTLLDRRLANGLITPDAYKAIVAKGQFYVPFVRDFLDDVKDSGSRGSKGLLQKGSGVRAMTDEAAMAQIKNPLQQAMVDTYLLEKQIARQRVTKLVVEGYDTNRAAAQDFIREVSSPSDGHTPTETVTVDGKTRHFQFVDEGFHDAWVGLAPQSADLAMKALRAVKNLQRVGVTMAPIFAARNAARDFTFSAVQSSGKHALGGAIAGAATGAAVDREHPVAGAIMGAAGGALAPHAANVLRGFAAVMGHEMGKDWLDSKVYSEFLREGGSGFGYFPRKQQEVAKLLTELQSDGKIHPADFVAPQNWWHALEMVNHAVEQAPRFAKYRQLRAAGTAIPDAILKARDLSVDFSNTGAGQAIRTWTSATPFFNAKLQGWDKNFRVFAGERASTGAMQWFGPKQQKAAAASMALITAPSIALWWQNKDDPDYWKQDYWVRNLFWLVPKGNGEFWKIPKPFEVGYAFASIPERFLDWAYQNKPEMFAGEDGKSVRVPYSLKKSMAQMGSALGLDVYNDTPGIVRPLLEAGLNKDTFTQRNIVPDRMTQLPADQQYDDRTSTLARAIGGATGSSPMQIDHLINGFTGNLGREVNAGMTQELRGAGLDDRGPAHDAPDPFTAGAATNMESQPAPVTDLLDEDKRLEGVQAGIKNIENQGRWQDLPAYYREHGQELGEVRLTRIFAEHVRQLSDVIHKIETNTSLPDEERQRRIAALRDAQFRLSQAYASASRR